MSSDRIDTDTLPFSPDKQKAVLGHCIYDQLFFSTVIVKLEPEWFSDILCCTIFRALKTWYSDYGYRPTVNELLDTKTVKAEDPGTRTKIMSLVAAVQTSRETFTYEPLLKEMNIWLRARLVQLAIPEAARAFNARKIDSSIDILNRMVREYYDVDFFGDGEATFDSYIQDLIQQDRNRDNNLTFGVRGIDEVLDEGGGSDIHRGLKLGDMTVLVASTNSGKSSTMITVAAHNILQGKSVLLITHEGNKDDIRGKLMRCMTQLTKPELLRFHKDTDVAARVNGCAAFLHRFMTFLPINRPGMTIEEVTSIVEKFQEKRRLTTGKGYDLLIDDYPAKLTTQRSSGGKFELRHIHDEVYQQFHQLGLHYNFHVLAAIQTNREGSKVNRRTGQYRTATRLLQMEDVMESWGPMTDADTVITLNRTPEDAERERMTMYVAKSRSGQTGWAVVCKTDFERCRTHSNELGYFVYRGEDTLGDGTSNFLNSHKNRVVTAEEIRYYRQDAEAAVGE